MIWGNPPPGTTKKSSVRVNGRFLETERALAADTGGVHVLLDFFSKDPTGHLQKRYLEICRSLPHGSELRRESRQQPLRRSKKSHLDALLSVLVTKHLILGERSNTAALRVREKSLSS